MKTNLYRQEWDASISELRLDAHIFKNLGRHVVAHHLYQAALKLEEAIGELDHGDDKLQGEA